MITYYNKKAIKIFFHIITTLEKIRILNVSKFKNMYKFNPAYIRFINTIKNRYIVYDYNKFLPVFSAIILIFGELDTKV